MVYTFVWLSDQRSGQYSVKDWVVKKYKNDVWSLKYDYEYIIDCNDISIVFFNFYFIVIT